MISLNSTGPVSQFYPIQCFVNEQAVHTSFKSVEIIKNVCPSTHFHHLQQTHDHVWNKVGCHSPQADSNCGPLCKSKKQ